MATMAPFSSNNGLVAAGAHIMGQYVGHLSSLPDTNPPPLVVVVSQRQIHAVTVLSSICRYCFLQPSTVTMPGINCRSAVNSERNRRLRRHPDRIKAAALPQPVAGILSTASMCAQLAANGVERRLAPSRNSCGCWAAHGGRL